MPPAGLPESFDTFVVGTALDAGDSLCETIDAQDGRWVDAQRTGSLPFLDLLQRLDGHINAATGRILPRWAIYDCAEIPGWIAGVSLPAAALPTQARELMAVDAGYEGAVPVSMVAVVPLVEPAAWHCYSLGALDLPGHADLRQVTLAMALQLLGGDSVRVATPWRAPRLAVYARLAPLELITAWTPAHSDPATLTARFDVTSDRVGALTSVAEPEPVDATRWIDADDTEVQRELQAELEKGRRYEIVAPPRPEGDRMLVPLREVGVS